MTGFSRVDPIKAWVAGSNPAALTIFKSRINRRARWPIIVYESRPSLFLTGDRAFVQAVLAEPAETIGVVLSISPHAESQRLPSTCTASTNTWSFSRN